MKKNIYIVAGMLLLVLIPFQNCQQGVESSSPGSVVSGDSSASTGFIKRASSATTVSEVLAEPDINQNFNTDDINNKIYGLMLAAKISPQETLNGEQILGANSFKAQKMVCGISFTKSLVYECWFESSSMYFKTEHTNSKYVRDYLAFINANSYYATKKNGLVS